MSTAGGGFEIHEGIWDRVDPGALFSPWSRRPGAPKFSLSLRPPAFVVPLVFTAVSLEKSLKARQNALDLSSVIQPWIFFFKGDFLKPCL